MGELVWVLDAQMSRMRTAYLCFWRKRPKDTLATGKLEIPNEKRASQPILGFGCVDAQLPCLVNKRVLTMTRVCRKRYSREDALQQSAR
jgi:hypothetical protein